MERCLHTYKYWGPYSEHKYFGPQPGLVGRYRSISLKREASGSLWGTSKKPARRRDIF